VCKVSLRCAALRIKKVVGIFRERITTTRTTTRVAFWDPPSGFKSPVNGTNVYNETRPTVAYYRGVPEQT